MYFHYGERETEYLRRRDKRLGAVIERVGHIERAVDPDLFSAVVHHIVGQQVSMRAQATVWERLRAALGEVSAQTVASLDAEALRGMGMSLRKAGYILDFARRVRTGAFSGRTCSATTTSPSAAACACSTATRRSTASVLSATAAAIRPMAAWRASTCGRWPAARSRG